MTLTHSKFLNGNQGHTEAQTMLAIFRCTRFNLCWQCYRTYSNKTPKEIAEALLKNGQKVDNNNFKDEKDVDKITKEVMREYPEAPTTCCMSACANCVWLEYADKLSEYYKDGGDRAIKDIEENVTDPNLRAYILHELRMRNKR